MTWPTKLKLVLWMIDNENSLVVTSADIVMVSAANHRAEDALFYAEILHGACPERQPKGSD